MKVITTTTFIVLLALGFSVLLMAETDATAGVPAGSIEKEDFGSLQDGTKVRIYTLVNKNGVTARLMNYGANLISVYVPDKDGKMEDVTLGYDSLKEYLTDIGYYGAIVGRIGNRTAKGKFTLDGVEYSLAVNDGENHLHGGLKGFDKVVWKAQDMQTDDGPAVKFTYLSKDGEEGYPGNMNVTVIYTLTHNDEVRIDYEAETDKATPYNLTHHSYFNLSGNTKENVLGHELAINADHYTPVGPGLIPTGEIAPVANSPMDFTTAKTIGRDIDQVKDGYDHNYVINGKMGELNLAATLYHEKSGRVMEIWTTEPGVQFYSGNFQDGKTIGKGKVAYEQYFGLCLETQHFPNSANQPNFPSNILRPGEKYTQTTTHKFYVKK